MLKLNAFCLLHGEKFSPSLAEKKTKLILNDKIEVGEIQNRGRFKGRSQPFGTATLDPPNEYIDFTGFTWLIATLNNSINVLRECGADEIIIHILVIYDKQCNLEFSIDELQKIANLKVPLAISVDKQ